MNHYRKTTKKYFERQKAKSCPFCNEATLANAVKETSSMYIVPNLTQYDLWELHDVSEHLLVVPKRHVRSLQELTKKERLEIIDSIAEYEAQNYNVYARGVGFVGKSVEHQHTHLIKVDNKRPRVALFLRKPYFLLKF